MGWLEELGLRLSWDQQQLLMRFLHGDGEALKLLFSQVDEVARCLMIKYLLMKTPLTKYDIARALGWDRHTQHVNRILRRCQDGGNDSNNPTTAMPEITMTVRELEEAIKGCVVGNCEKVRAMVGMARLREYDTYADVPPLALITGGFIVNTLRNHGFLVSEIRQVMAVNWYALRRLLRLSYVFEFSRVSDFRPKTVFDAYWQFTSLTTLRLPFIIKSRFDPPNDVYSAFGDESLCHMYIAGYLIAESAKSTKDPSRRFKEVNTTHPASVALLLSVANHLAKHGMMTKVYINERQRRVSFVFDGLPKDVKRFVEDIWGDPVALTKLPGGEFLAFLSGLIAGDGTIAWGNVAQVVLTGNLKEEKPLYAVVQSELGSRFGVKATLSERKNINTIELSIWNDAVRLLYLIPPVIEPLKELRRQLVLRRGVIGVTTAKKIFELLGDEKENGEKGIRKLQSYQATRFLTTLTRLGLIRLKEVEGRAYHILETPTNPRGWLQT